jgi:hypothetical protein
MPGLAHTEAATASLLLTLEGVEAALLAWFAFHENFDHHGDLELSQCMWICRGPRGKQQRGSEPRQ